MAFRRKTKKWLPETTSRSNGSHEESDLLHKLFMLPDVMTGKTVRNMTYPARSELEPTKE